MSKQKNRGGMGSHKHGVSGHAGKSPKLRLAIKREAEKDERKPKKTKTYPTVAEALKDAQDG